MVVRTVTNDGDSSSMYERYIKQKVEIALADTPVVMIAGPRQCGKTTLAKELITDEWSYITFDDPAQLSIAKHDPVGFIRNLPSKHTVLDEVQRVPELFICLKQAVDEDRYPGRFLLTGSANALLIPQLSDSLAGRMEVIPLMPLSGCEIKSSNPVLLESLINQTAPMTKDIRVRDQLIENIIGGGFPEPLARESAARRVAWYTQYLNSLIQRDITEIARIDNIDAIPRFIALLANHAGQLINFSEIGAQIGLSRQTVSRYLRLLEQLFLVTELPAWHRNDNKRLAKAPKIHLVDTGLHCALKRLNTEKLVKNPEIFGHLLESYVYGELIKQASWLDEPIYFSHYRDRDKYEVDLVLETASHEVIGIEVKAKASLNPKDFQGLQRLQAAAGSDFHIGILLYDGDHTTAFGDNLFAVPIGTIWGAAS